MANSPPQPPAQIQAQTQIQTQAQVSDQKHGDTSGDMATAERTLTPQAQRALAEAQARRDAAAASPVGPPEQGGRAGPDPVRYGDWENGGIASDF
jgi:hypothetical protein